MILLIIKICSNSKPSIKKSLFKQGKGEMQTHWLEHGPHERQDEQDDFFYEYKWEI